MLPSPTVKQVTLFKNYLNNTQEFTVIHLLLDILGVAYYPTVAPIPKVTKQVHPAPEDDQYSKKSSQRHITAIIQAVDYPD